MIKTDVLVIGSGIAGLSFAIKTAEKFPERSIYLLTKAELQETNTKYAQGGIATVLSNNDSFESHIEDTVVAGDGLSNRKIVEIVVKEAPARLQELIDLGTQFDKMDNGEYDLAKEGGHSAHRILHHKDITGLEIERALIKKAKSLQNITTRENVFVVDLITDHHLGKKITLGGKNTCYGAYVLNTDTGKTIRVLAKVTMLASGGAGQTYDHTTNPIIATGDGIAMAYRAKALVEDMEFVQFHPTSLYQVDVSPSYLISEAVRGFGAYIKNSKGNRFVFNYDKRGELASRDIVSKAIDDELNKSGEKHVYLDCSHLDLEVFVDHFPNIYKKCKSIGIDIKKDWIPVVPAAHYTCGGIVVDEFGNSSITNLYACGESSRTGLHGANRLASNSLLEGIVFAHRSAEDLATKLAKIELNEGVPSWNIKGTADPDELVLITHSRKELQIIMSDYMGIVRSKERTKRALRRLEIHYHETEELYTTTKISPQLCELRNLISIAYIIVNQSSLRTENKGSFYNIDLV
tara:strand:+ start:8607 stop:10166 length:1560 start_codon:yes stop_codon:yes gene_type:complete